MWRNHNHLSTDLVNGGDPKGGPLIFSTVCCTSQLGMYVCTLVRVGFSWWTPETNQVTCLAHTLHFFFCLAHTDGTYCNCLGVRDLFLLLTCMYPVLWCHDGLVHNERTSTVLVRTASSAFYSQPTHPPTHGHGFPLALLNLVQTRNLSLWPMFVDLNQNTCEFRPRSVRVSGLWSIDFHMDVLRFVSQGVGNGETIMATVQYIWHARWNQVTVSPPDLPWYVPNGGHTACTS